MPPDHHQGGDKLDYSTRASFRDDLIRIGLRAGDTVMVDAAMSKVGPVLNGPDALSMALLDVVGPEGTMLVYTAGTACMKTCWTMPDACLPSGGNTCRGLIRKRHAQ